MTPTVTWVLGAGIEIPLAARHVIGRSRTCQLQVQLANVSAFHAELAIDDPQLLNLWVYRARQQLAQLKLHGAAKVIERREGAGQLRLGLRRLRVIDA